MRFVKFLSWLVVIFLVLILLGALAIYYFVDLNRYKTQMQDAILRETGRHLEVQGDFTLHLIPSPYFSVGAVSLGSPPGYPQPLLQAKQARIVSSWAGLAAGRLGTVELEGVQIHLNESLSGNNWTFHFQPSGESDQQIVATQEKPAKGTVRESAQALALQGIRIKDALITYTSVPKQAQMSFEHIDVQVGMINGKDPVPIDVSFTFQSHDHKAIPFGLSAMMDFDQATTTLLAKPLKLTVGQDTISGQMSVRHVEQPIFTANLAAPVFHLSNLVDTHDADVVLQQVQLGYDLGLPNRPDISPLVALNGRFFVKSGKVSLTGVDFHQIAMNLRQLQANIQARAGLSTLLGDAATIVRQAKGKDRVRTVMRELVITGQVENGMAQSDFSLEGRGYRLLGAGTVQLHEPMTLDYRIAATIPRRGSQQAGGDQADQISVPMYIRGPIAQPAWGINDGLLRKHVRSLVVHEVKNHWEEKVRGKVQGLLNQLLQ